MEQDELISLLQQRKTPSVVDVNQKLNVPSLFYDFEDLVNSNKNTSHSFLLQMMKMKNLIGLNVPFLESVNNSYNGDDVDMDDVDNNNNINNNDDVENTTTNRLIGFASRISNSQVSLESISDENMAKIIRLQEKGREKLERDEMKSENKVQKRLTRTGKRIRKGYFEGIDADTELLDKYNHYFKDRTKLNVRTYYTLNNRYMFLNEIRALFSKLDFKMESGKTCDDKDSGDGFIPLSHQLLVQRYLNSHAPYRGLLLYHGLGSGKTCSSIGIIEGLKNSRRVFIMTPASLQKNYKTQMKFCGDQIYRDNNYWVRINVPPSSDVSKEAKETMLALMKITSLKKRQLLTMKRVYLVDESRSESNYSTFSMQEKNEISKQIDMMIDKKYHYISYNGISERMWRTKFKTSETTNPFTNSVVVIDEAHNFVSRVINKLNIKKTSVSTMIYESLMSAENCKVVMLSGTPMINYPCEMGVMFNIIGGYNFCITLQIKSGEREKSKDIEKMSKNYIRTLFEKEDSVDYIEFDQSKRNIVRVVRNPYNFVNSGNKVVFDNGRGNISLRRFQNIVEGVFSRNGYTIVQSKIEKFEKFPQTEEEFNKYFIGKNGEFTNKVRFQNKISGMVSYLGDRKEMMPEIVVPDHYDDTGEDIFIERIPMNEYVLSKYNEIRLVERKMEKQMAKHKNKDGATSTYRVFSRSACNFVFPEFIHKPQLKQRGDIDEDDADAMDDDEKLSHVDGKYDESDLNDPEKTNEANEYREAIRIALDKLSQNREKIFNSDIQFLVSKQSTLNSGEATNFDVTNSLRKYSPKFYSLLRNLITENLDVCNLLYSNFRTIEGIGIFKMILEYYGYTELRIERRSDGEYYVKAENPYYQDEDFITRKYFSLYTGTEGVVEKEMVRNIYNNNFDKLPHSVRNNLEEMFGSELTNLHGEIINLLMISASGAEGIDLKNVRNVHIVEPYWHPVRIEQVIGRARRICSHSELPKEEQDVKVYMYLMIHNKELLHKKQHEYQQLLTFDKDQRSGKLVTTDEALYNIMKRKKKLSDEILGALKESSIDCLINYENSEKCMHVKFSPQVISQIDYKVEGRRLKEQDSDMNAEEVPLVSRRLIIRKSDGSELGTKLFAIDEDTNVAYAMSEGRGPKVRMGYRVIDDGKAYFSTEQPVDG